MEIQHRKLINAKFLHYAHHVSNAHCATQNGLGKLDSNPTLKRFFCQCMVPVILYLNQTGTMNYLICLLCKLTFLLLYYHNMSDLHDKEER